MSKPKTPGDGRVGPGPSEFVNEAYLVEDEAAMVEFYRKWAEDYDNQMMSLGYLSPMETARLLLSHLHDANADILDIGCGTGLTSKLLAEAGMRNIQGLDLSPDMVRVAGERGIYQRLSVADVTKPLAFADASFDAVISSGTFTHGHVGPEPLREICRVLKTGGLLACTVHQDLWEELGFAAVFSELTDGAVLREVSRALGSYYEGRQAEGWYCLMQKL
ncbi:MAG: class I SAM-dependent methyltransferase [Pseudomonadota bacterium]